MNESIHSEFQHRPSALSAFVSGGMSGFVSGAVMALIIAAVVPVLPLLGIVAAAEATFVGTLLSSGPLMVIASTLFGGVMSAKRAMFDAPHSPATPTMVPVPVPSVGYAPMMAPAPALAMADDSPATSAPAKSWVEQTGRSAGQSSAIQQILADGSLSDKDRASALLASREASDQQVAATR